MPIYEYECPKHGRFEVTQRITDSPLRSHEGCGETVRRLISNSSFTLKGSGWYATDYARPSSDQGGSKSRKSRQTSAA